MEKLLSIGKIINFHGISGEVKVGYTEGTEDLLTEINEIYATKDSKTITLTAEKVRFHKNIAIIKFKELNSIDEVIALKGAYLKAPKSETKSFLKEDEFYIDDLVGLTAYDSDNNIIGKVSGVSIAKGQDLLFIKDDFGKEHLIPFVKDIVTEVSLKEQRITVCNIEGLLEIK